MLNCSSSDQGHTAAVTRAGGFERRAETRGLQRFGEAFGGLLAARPRSIDVAPQICPEEGAVVRIRPARA